MSGTAQRAMIWRILGSVYIRRRVLWELWETRRVFQAARWNREAISKALWKTWGKDGDEARKSPQVFHRAVSRGSFHRTSARMETHKGRRKRLLVNYPEIFKEKMVLRMSGPSRISANALSEEGGASQTSLSKWVRDAAGVEPVAKRVNGQSSKAKGKRRQDWTAEEKLDAVLESASLSEQELGEYLRRKGLHEAQLEQWRRQVADAAMEALSSKSSRKKASVEAKRVRTLGAGATPQGKGAGGDGGTVGA